MNGKEFLNAVDLLEKEKHIDRDIIFEAMELALLSAYKKNFNSLTNAKVNINRETGIPTGTIIAQDQSNSYGFRINFDVPAAGVMYYLMFRNDTGE